jgi:hypothetical protein
MITMKMIRRVNNKKIISENKIIKIRSINKNMEKYLVSTVIKMKKNM